MHIYSIFWLQGDERIFQKLEDITSVLQETLGDLCACNFTSNKIDKTFFHCFDPLSYYVTYRARLSGTPETDSHTLISHIEDWVSGGPSILVQGVLLIIDNECSVSISSVDDGECRKSPTSQSTTDNTAAVIGGVVVAIVLIIALLVFGMAVLVLVWKSRHGNLSVQKNKE